MVSIIVPSYNSAHLISVTLDSILESTYHDYEVIVIDDGSSDDTKKVVASYLKDKRFNYYYQENKGLAGARNTGIDMAKGKYLVFLDSDDIILPDKLQHQVVFLNSHPDIDIVYSDSQWFVEDDLEETIPVKFPKYEGDVLSYLLYGNFMHVNSVMVRTEKVREQKGFDISFRELEDWDLWLRLAINGSKFGYTPGILSKVRIRKGSMTSNQLRMNKTMVKVLTKNIPELVNQDYSLSLVNKGWHAQFIYRLKAHETKDYLKDLYKVAIKQGLNFIPIAFKMHLKLYLNLFLKQNHTTKELESLWNS